MPLSPPFQNRIWIRNGLYLIAYALPLLIGQLGPGNHAINWFLLVFNTVFLLTAWFEHVVILNRFLAKRQYGLAALGTVGALAFFIGCRYVGDQILLPALVNMSNYDPTTLTFSFYVFDNQYYALMSVGLGLVFKLIDDWFIHQQERTELLAEKNTAELAFLKSQVNPHFLFNTLNNIYSLAYTKSDEAPGAILKLSELMRYMIYDNNGTPRDGGAGATHKVALSKEIAHLQNFIELEKLRVANAQVQVQTEGNTDLYRIEPLILLSFVENAFKHGDLTDPAHPLVIDLSVRQGKLLFDTINKKSNRQKDSVGGIGLQNVRRRLDLLYPNQYTLRIDDTADAYACRLELSL